METASPLIPRIHFPSHWLSCGHTRPQIAGSALDSEMTLICFFKVSFFYFMDKCRDIDGYRTALHTFCIFTVEAAGSFFHCFFFIISKTYFIKIGCSYLWMPALLQELSLIHLPLFVTSAISTSAMMCITFTQFQKCTALFCLVHSCCLFIACIKIDQMTVKFRSVYAGKFHFIAYQ